MQLQSLLFYPLFTDPVNFPKKDSNWKRCAFFVFFLSNEKEHNKETVCEIAFSFSSCKYRI